MAEYEKLKQENVKLLEDSQNQEELSEAEKRAEKYLAKISRDTLINLEVGFADNMEGSEFVKEKDIFSVATKIAETADLTTKYTPEELELIYEPTYQYILYDEDNAVYEITVYGSDYVVFSDLPKNVYYVPDASALGDAFLHYRSNYPSSNLLHRLADSPLMIDSKGNYYTHDICAKTASYIDKMEKEKSSRKKAEEDWKKNAKKGKENVEPSSVTYQYFHHGNVMKVTLYDRYICIENVDEKRTWYKVNNTNIQDIKSILKKDRETRVSSEKDQEKTENNSEKKSHTKEIEEESVISSEE